MTRSWAGSTIPQGAELLLVMGSANRDESHFADAEDFDVTRANARDHLAFGYGIHYCLGNMLAKLQTRIVVEEVARLAPGLQLADEPHRVRGQPVLPRTRRGARHLGDVMTTDAPYVRFFDEGGDPTVELLGGKCASLVSMTAAGMPVPPGFAITTAAYDAFVDATGIRDEISHKLATLDADHVSSVDAASATIRDHLTSRPMPEPVRAAIVAAHESLQARFASPVPVAVRSSATAEDLPGASFAGQQDTYLWVTGLDSVLHHVRECWASLYTSRAIIYRLGTTSPTGALDGRRRAEDGQLLGLRGRDHHEPHHRRPVQDHHRRVVRRGGDGRQRQVTPDNILLDKVMLSIVSETIGDKHAELVARRDRGRLVEVPVDPERRTRRCLTDDEVVAVATMAKRAEKHYGCPQDIEWAFDADLPPGESLLLLQSRPETVHSAPAATTTTVSTPSTPGPASGLLSGITASLTEQEPLMTAAPTQPVTAR